MTDLEPTTDITQHFTLNQQTPDRPGLTPPKSQEMDIDFAESNPGNLMVDFDTLIRTEQGLDKQLERQDVSRYEDIIDGLYNSGEIAPVYEEILNRIRTETNYFHEYDEAEFFYFLLNHATKIRGISKIRFEPNKKGIAEYNFGTRSIEISGYKPERDMILIRLARNGMIPNSIAALKHEVTHSLQRGSFMREFIDFYMGAKGRKQSLLEAHAYRSTPFAAADRVSLTELLRQISENKEDYPHADINKLEYSIHAIDQLKALGFTEKEIGEIVLESGSWDRRSGRYPRIQARIDQKARELHLDEADLDNLVLADKIERNIDRLRATQITRQVLEAYQGKNS